jgi:rod shape determining protein RodA
LKLADRIKSGISLYIRYNDWFLFLSCTAAAAYGIILVYSAAASQNGQSREYLVQTVSFLIGVAAALVISRIDYEIICRLWPFLSGISLFLVLLTFTPLGLKVADDQAWLYIPVIGTFQPSELLKITFIISFANHLSKVQHKMNELRTALLLCLHGAVPVLLIFKQGDDGTALVFICIFASMLFIAGLRPLYFLIGATAGAAAVPVAWNMMDELKKARFLCLIFVEKYADNVGWQQNLALIAIGSGKLWGVGYLKGGNQYLYARNTDFIFTVAAGEFGFMGGLALFAILILILLALYRSILAARDLQGMLLCGGLMALIGFQSLINLGMNLRLLPVIGITLPFFSRGGSSLATLFIGVGVALSVYYSGKTRSHDTIFTNNRY